MLLQANNQVEKFPVPKLLWERTHIESQDDCPSSSDVAIVWKVKSSSGAGAVDYAEAQSGPSIYPTEISA